MNTMVRLFQRKSKPQSEDIGHQLCTLELDWNIMLVSCCNVFVLAGRLHKLRMIFYCSVVKSEVAIKKWGL